jgi:nucleotide-binding universal stress UspA family protein
LVPLDSSEEAERVLPLVGKLAKDLMQPLVLLTVIPDAGDLSPAVSAYDAEMQQLTHFRRERAQAYLQSMCDRLASDGIAATAVVKAGAAAQTIIAIAHDEQAGLIAMATHGRAGPARLFLGSVADRVVRTAPVPVLLMRPRDERTFGTDAVQHILLPLDGSELAETAIPYAEFLALRLKVPITAIRDIPINWISGADPTGMGWTVAPDVVQSIEDEAQDYLQRVVERLRAEGVVAHARFGPFSSPAADIVGLAEEAPGALVVMTTHGRSGLERALLGSVTDRVIRSSAAPVLVVPASTEDVPPDGARSSGA